MYVIDISLLKAIRCSYDYNSSMRCWCWNHLVVQDVEWEVTDSGNEEMRKFLLSNFISCPGQLTLSVGWIFDTIYDVCQNA